MLIINPRNDGEGAYEAELHIKIPPEADYTGAERNNKVNEKQHVSDNKAEELRVRLTYIGYTSWKQQVERCLLGSGIPLTLSYPCSHSPG